MLRRLMWLLILTAIAAVSVPVQALSDYQVGGCKPKLTNFTTIQAAVTSVPAGATILVCPGVYPEQVTITQPLTLQGIASGNASRSVITINPIGIPGPNVTSIFGQSLYAQVLVQNVTPPGPVNITGITVDGNGGNVGCSTTIGLAGIFYAVGTSGTINEVTARNQQSAGCGFGIWAENTAGATQTITVENCSVRNFDATGISALSDQAPATMAATIKGNFLNTANPGVAIDFGVMGTITNNAVTGGQEGIGSLLPSGTRTVSGNTVADLVPGGYGLSVGSSATATANKVSNVTTAFFFSNSQPIESNIVVKSNTVMNTTYAFDLNCSSYATVSANTVNDAQFTFQKLLSPITGGANYNVDTLQTGTCP